MRPAWQEAFREVVVNGALRDQGHTIALDPRVVLYQNRRRLGLREAVHERFVWGRSYAATRRASLSLPKRLAFTALSPVLPAVLSLRMARTSWERGSFPSFVRALPMTLLLLATWSAGEGAGYTAGLNS